MTAEFEAAYQIEQVRVRGGIPQTDSRFTDARILSLLTSEMQGAIAAMVHAAKADHGVVPYQVTAPASVARYSLPPSAFANTLRDVYWLSADGRATPIQQISASDRRVYTYSGQPGINPLFYVLQGSTMVLYPTPSAAGTLAMPYYARPSTLVDVADVALVRSPSAPVPGTVTFSIQSPPTGLQSSRNVDVVRSTPGFETIISNTSATITEVVTGTYAVLISGLPEDASVSAGDYLCLPGQSPVPQLPVELFPLLHARAAYVAVPSTGDSSQAASALASQVADLTRLAVDFLRPRVESADPPTGRGLYENPGLRGLV